MDAQNIAKELVELGLTQSEIHRRAGVSQSTVSHLLSGKRGKRTSFDVVRRLEILLTLAKDQLKEGNDAFARH